MKGDKIVEFIKYNNDNLKFEIKIRSKVRYANFIIIKFLNYNFYYILVNYI